MLNNRKGRHVVTVGLQSSLQPQYFSRFCIKSNCYLLQLATYSERKVTRQYYYYCHYCFLLKVTAIPQDQDWHLIIVILNVNMRHGGSVVGLVPCFRKVAGSYPTFIKT